MCTRTRFDAANLGVSAAATFPSDPELILIGHRQWWRCLLRLSHYSLMLQLLVIITNIIGVKWLVYPAAIKNLNTATSAATLMQDDWRLNCEYQQITRVNIGAAHWNYKTKCDACFWLMTLFCCLYSPAAHILSSLICKHHYSAQGLWLIKVVI